MKALKRSVLARHYRTNHFLCILPSANTHHRRFSDGTAVYHRKRFPTSSPVKDWRLTHPWIIRSVGEMKNLETKRLNEGVCYSQPRQMQLV